MEEGTLVHGRVHAEQGPILHAWIEVGEVVIEVTKNAAVPRERYYTLLKPEVHARFSAEEASIAFIRQHHYGPWAQDAADPSGKIDRPKPRRRRQA